MAEWYDRDGQPIADILTWGRKHQDMTYKRIAETTLPNGRWVSTVWVGIDMGFSEGPPLIFETMVFPSHGDMGDLDCDRYATEAEARAGHEAMCAKWIQEHPPEEDA